MAVSKNLDVSKLEWVQWENKRGAVVAHAIDPDSVARTGKLRTLSGALVPEGAVPAEPGTERDHFPVSIVERVQSHQARAQETEQARAEAKAKREAEAAERAAKRAEAKAQAQAAREAKAAKKAAEKAERAAARAAEREAKKAQPKPETKAQAEKVEKAAGPPPKASHIKKTRNGKSYEVRHYVDGIVETVGTFPVGDLPEDADPAKVTVSVTDKVWVVLVGKKRIAYGKREE